MAPKPHSQTVRGTLSNPKTQAAKTSTSPPPQLGDPTSLKPETEDGKSLPSNDSAPPAEDQTSSPDSAPTVVESNASVGSKRDLPHSKRVRGTLANSDGKKVNRTQLGDPASLKAETSTTELEQTAEREGTQKKSHGKSKL